MAAILKIFPMQLLEKLFIDVLTEQHSYKITLVKGLSNVTSKPFYPGYTFKGCKLRSNIKGIIQYKDVKQNSVDYDILPFGKLPMEI